MTIRVLTIDEMLELEEGAAVIYIAPRDPDDAVEDLPVGAPMYKKRHSCNDVISVAFDHSDDCNWDFFYEGEIGVVEAEDMVEELGIFRPELETRKIGKIRVELVDDGFPLALREVAKIMTWAQTAKGYKDHDWQNLPNAEVALAAAASRHRTDHIKQRVVDGLDIDQCVDVESGLLHKAHEAFGVLSQLELMLRGKFEARA